MMRAGIEARIQKLFCSSSRKKGIRQSDRTAVVKNTLRQYLGAKIAA